MDVCPPWPPVSSLPEDILHAIFTQETLARSSVAFSHVCTAWRQIILSIPSLWRVIIFDPQRYPSSSSLTRIYAYLQRSQSYPLTIDIGFGPDDADMFPKILDLLVAHAHASRWESFYLSSTNTTSIFPLYEALQNLDTPLLTHLSLNFNPLTGLGKARRSVRRYHHLLPDEPGILRGGAPLLISFRMFGVGIDLFQPYHLNLTSLYLRDEKSSFLSPHWLSRIFSLTNIECLSISGVYVQDELQDDISIDVSQRVTLLRLRHLHFQLPGLALEFFLTRIAAPNIRSLFLVNALIPVDVDTLTVFPTVTHLRLLGCLLPWRHSTSPPPFLSLFPNTRHLSIWGPAPGQLVTRTMFYLTSFMSERGPPLFPSLVSIMTDSDDLALDWRSGLLVNPSEVELEEEILRQGLPDGGWFHDVRWPPEPAYYHEKLSSRGDAYTPFDIFPELAGH